MDERGFRNIAFVDWRGGDYRAIAISNQPIEDLLNIPDIDYFFHPVDGLGIAKNAFFVTDDGCYFSIVQYNESDTPITEIWVLHDPEDPKLMYTDLDRVLVLLELRRSDFCLFNF